MSVLPLMQIVYRLAKSGGGDDSCLNRTQACIKFTWLRLSAELHQWPLYEHI